MHIPNSAISPATSLAAGAAMLPVWCVAGRRVRETLSTRQVPLLAIGAAFSFTIMMFNIPVPGGTTVHPIGGTLLAVLLGPWAAIIGVTVALVIQALFFADGGVFAAGANCFTMAFAMPVFGYFAYRLAAGRSAAGSQRRALAAGIGAYAGLNVAALLTAVILGMQPVLFHDAAGHALYFPFGLAVTVPAIMIAHLTVAGIAEGVVTTLVVRYLQASGISLYDAGGAGAARAGRREWLWVGLGALAALSPLGLLARGDAWGEWGAEDLQQRAGYLPAKLAAVEAHGWKGFNLLPDYLGDHGPLAYVGAALVGITVISLILLLLGRLLARRREAPPTGGNGDGGTPREPTVRPGELPAWMRGTPSATPPTSAADETDRTLRAGFVEKTITGLAAATQETVFGETWARRDGLLQRLDPRMKVVALFGFVALVSCLHRAPALIGLYLLAVALGALSGVPFRLLAARVWLSVPLFVGAVTLPAALNVVTPGPALFVLLQHPYLAVTQPGLIAAALLTFRVGVAVSFVALLTLTTRWQDLLRGLRVLLAPKLFLTVLAMTYRYLAVLMQAASEMFTARKSRTVGRTDMAEGRRFLGGAMGALFGKTLALTDEVHAAMLSRGWTGEARTLRPLQLQALDAVWGGAMLLAAVMAAALEGYLR